MRTFKCECGSPVFFVNTQCLSCSRELGFLPDVLDMASFANGSAGDIETSRGRYRKCANYVQEGVCNWMVPSDSGEDLCQACRLNNVIPNLSEPENRALWQEVEQAKRRLVYSLDALKLPVLSKNDDASRGLSFDIKQSVGSERVLTGHADGLITLNLDEAAPAERERMRVAMKERYRTLLGHFRHEIGHYFWDRLVADAGKHDSFRKLFGDERVDYTDALRQHYARAPDPGYADHFITPYAASHPWEDFAESFAHYLHMIDTLETAQQYGFVSAPLSRAEAFESLMDEWYDLTVALNSLNRSMGQPDAYPFAISPIVKEKLRFVHELVHAPRIPIGIQRAATGGGAARASGTADWCGECAHSPAVLAQRKP